jgi:hypothetical protein
MKGPYVISDHMEPTKHHATGKVHDSKSQFRRDTKAAGCVEIGNEPIRPCRPIQQLTAWKNYNNTGSP